MFYRGDLQSGIALALQESKCVVCFVAGDNEESWKWETEWLAETETIVGLLQRYAVTLRLQAGSQEAGFLTSFCPVPSVPALVFIEQGRIEDRIWAGPNQQEFTSKVIAALTRVAERKAQASPASTPAAAPAASAAAASTVPTATTSDTPSQSRAGSTPTSPTPQAPTPTTPTAQQPTSTPSERQARIQVLLEERRKRLEADKKAKDAAEKRAQQERAQARATPGSSGASTPRTAEQTYAQQQKQAKLDAAREKERIRKLVEHDRLERREREEQRRALAQAEREAQLPQDNDGGLADAATGPDRVDRRGCMVQVRLLDGSSMRTSFFPEDRPGKAVRRWIDENRVDGDYPYSFKQVMTPAPSRVISMADEKQTLRELGMTPSASLVLVPVKGVVAAYQGGGASGVFQRFLGVLGGLFMSMFEALFRLMQSIMGVGPDAAPGQQQQQQQQPTTDQAPTSNATGSSKDTASDAGASVNIRTLRDQQKDKDKDHQLYNGNSLDFEPRKDDDAGSGSGQSGI